MYLLMNYSEFVGAINATLQSTKGNEIMAKKPAPATKTAAAAAPEVNRDHLAQVVNAGPNGLPMPAAFAVPLTAAGLIETGATLADDMVQVRATQAGVAYMGGAVAPAETAPAAPASKYALFDGIELPEPAASNSPIRPSGYPFEKMGVNQAFFLPDSDFKSGNAHKSIASTVAAQNKAHWPKRFVRRRLEDAAAFGYAGVSGAAVKRVEDGQGGRPVSTRGRKPRDAAVAAPVSAPAAPAGWAPGPAA